MQKKVSTLTFSGNIYAQNDDVAMGLPLGLVLPNIFMVELERSIIPTLTDKSEVCDKIRGLYSLLYKDRFN